MRKPASSPRACRRRLLYPVASGALGVSLALIALMGSGSQPTAQALAPCITHSNTSEELQFVAILQSWRDRNIAGSHQLTVSAPLNAAAAGYAQYLVDHPGASGHYADGGNWAQRAVQCGYPSNQAAGGEGLAVAEGSGQLQVGPQQALDIMTAWGGSGVNVPSNVGLPVKCVGAAKAASADGRKVAWVTLIFAASGACPQAATGGGGGSTVTVTPGTPTPSPTPTSTPTKTPSPTPVTFHAFAPLVSTDEPR